MYDLFFVSYAEPNADANWQALKNRFPHAKRVHGIKGIANAHKACATLSFTSMFYTIDGDTTVLASWDFTYVPPTWDRIYLHLWYSMNPVNRLSYGYGSVKLWPRQRVLEHEGSWLDFTTCVGNIKIVPEVIAVTRFNSSPFESWKSAFRECVKLSHNLFLNPADTESKLRLEAWMHPLHDAENSRWCCLGAQHAVDWYRMQSSAADLTRINDFEWLQDFFHKTAAQDQ